MGQHGFALEAPRQQHGERLHNIADYLAAAQLTPRRSPSPSHDLYMSPHHRSSMAQLRAGLLALNLDTKGTVGGVISVRRTTEDTPTPPPQWYFSKTMRTRESLDNETPHTEDNLTTQYGSSGAN